jgi:hypothetical protein
LTAPGSVSLWRRSRSALAARILAVVVAAGLAVGVWPAAATAKDTVPPKFAGLQSATTCVAGPIWPGRTTSYHLRWKAATDNVTPQSHIVYDIYKAQRSGGEDFSHPTYTTRPGVTSFDTPKLSATRTFYFVVRARDQAGNRDSNKVERRGVNLCV